MWREERWKNWNLNWTSRLTRPITVPSKVDQKRNRQNQNDELARAALAGAGAIHLRPNDLDLGHFKYAEQSMSGQFVILAVDVMAYRL